MSTPKAVSEKIVAATSALPTPFIMVEEKILRHNIRRIHAYADRHKLAVRPHVKTHKSLAVGRMQMDAGAVGIAVAKAGEAQVMSAVGKGDITVSYPALGSHRADAIAGLASMQQIRVAADSRRGIDELSDAAQRYGTSLGIMVMFDAGLHRCGLAKPDEVAALARYAESRPGLRFDGIQIYLGHLYGEAASEPKSFDAVRHIWEPVFAALCREGLRPQCVSSGSTPSLFNTHLIPHITEIRVGTAYLNDYFVLKFGHCALEDCAARVVTQVVSAATDGRVITDAGSKALSAKQLLRHENLELGHIPEYPQARIFRLHEEHGWIDVSRCPVPPRLGDRLTIVPVNVALCMNLFNSFFLLSGSGKVTEEKIDARGCLV